MKTAAQISLVAAATLLLSGTAMALPSVGDSVKIAGKGYGTTSGGEFKLDIGADGVIDYTSFCAEKTEYVTVGYTYTIASVEDYAEKGGAGATNGRDYLSDATKWVMYNYITNQGLFFEATRTNGMADEVQKIIWALEDEQAYSSSLYNQVLAQQNYSFTGYTVKVLNLMSGNTYAQSQIIAEAVPEPTTMLLFGAGMLGLASAARRREK